MEASSPTPREAPPAGTVGAPGVARGVARVSIAGATGYAGQQLLRLLARHPFARVTAAMSSAPGGPSRSLPALARIWEGTVLPFSPDALAADADVVFLALPDEAAAEVAPRVLEQGARVIDLSGAFRLRQPAERQRWYPATRALAVEPVYGLTERNRPALATALLIACPGCYPTAALLPLAPLREAGLIAGDVIIDAKSGVSGAGKRPTERTHFSECHGSVSAYAVSGHRHQPEIEQELGGPVTFVPHLVPLDRGILETIYTTLRPGATEGDVRAALEAAYRDAPFVRLRGDALPEIKHVAHTNFCDIGWHVNPATRRLVLVSVLDNLVKGAAGQAIQDFNVALGYDERTGLIQ
jgi:N-acetyl-gamma-glutamyl-phosphate reductase